MTGKNKCKLLKEIRQKIADENEIPFVTAQCQYKGHCKGTCPKCEEELAYLERELLKRQKMGKSIAVLGISAAALLFATKGCDLVEDAVQDVLEQTTSGVVTADNFDVDLTDPQ